MLQKVLFIVGLFILISGCKKNVLEVDKCESFDSDFSLRDSDGDGLTDCEETTNIDNPNTILVPKGISDPNNPFNGILDTIINVGGTLNESLQSVVKTKDGGFICLGYTQSSNGDIYNLIGSSDFWVLKYSNSMKLEWSKTYGGTKEDIGYRIIQIKDETFVLVGYSKSDDFDLNTNNGQKDVFVLKISSTGDVIWSKSYGFEGDEEGLSVIETLDDGLLVCGYIDVTASGGKGNDLMLRQHGVGDIWALKLDGQGDFEWRRYFGGSNNDRAYDVVQTDNGDYIIAGTSESLDFDIANPQGSYDYWVVRLSGKGDIVWEKSLGGTEIDDCYRIIKVENGNYLLVGNTFSLSGNGINNKGYSDIWIVKINEKGEMIWQKTYGGSAFDSAVSAYVTKKGEYLIAGNSRSKDKDLDENKGQNDIWIIKINTDGDIVWNKSIGGSGYDIANDIIALDDYSLVVIGESNSKDINLNGNKGFTDGVLLRLK